MYEAETFFTEKLRKFSFVTHVVLNKKYKILQRKKMIEKYSKKSPCLLALMSIRKSIRSEISNVFIFYDRAKFCVKM